MLPHQANEGVLRILQSPSITGTSPSDCLVSYPGYSLGGLTPLQRCSQCILQPQPTGQATTTEKPTTETTIQSSSSSSKKPWKKTKMKNSEGEQPEELDTSMKLKRRRDRGKTKAKKFCTQPNYIHTPPKPLHNSHQYNSHQYKPHTTTVIKTTPKISTATIP